MSFLSSSYPAVIDSSSSSSSTSSSSLSSRRRLLLALSLGTTAVLSTLLASYVRRRVFLASERAKRESNDEDDDEMPPLETIPTGKKAETKPVSVKGTKSAAAASTTSSSSSTSPSSSSSTTVTPKEKIAKKKSPARPSPLTWSSTAFKSAALHYLQSLNSNPSESVPPLSLLEAELRQCLPKVLKEFGHEERAMGAHLLLATNAFHLQESASEEEFDKLMKTQSSDMSLAWSLLAIVGDSATESQLDIMRLQVAQCLKDASLMLPIFDRMTERHGALVAAATRPPGGPFSSGSSTPPDTPMSDELVLLFTTAPLLGRWRDMIRFGDIISRKHDLCEFHEAPMDYQILHELSKEEVRSARGDVAIDQLQWKSYDIKRQMMKLSSIECDDPSTIASLNNEFNDASTGERAWKSIEINDSRFVRCGALGQLRSFSPLPLALIGPASEDRLYAKGYVLMAEPSSKQTETYDMTSCRRDQLLGVGTLQGAAAAAAELDLPATIHWRGMFEMEQEPRKSREQEQSGGSIPRLKLRFELEMSMIQMN